MKASLIRQIDTLSQALRAEGYEVKTTIKLNQGVLLIIAKLLSEQNMKDLRQASPETRITEGG